MSEETKPEVAKPSNIDALQDLLGFDPNRGPGALGEALKEALGEVAEERRKAGIAKAKELLSQAIDLSKKMDSARKEFDKQQAKFDKELGGLLRRLDGGKEPKDDDPGEKAEGQEANR